MITYGEKYDLFEKGLKRKDTDAAHAQVAILYWTLRKSIQEIAEITEYAKSTLKQYVDLYSELTNQYDVYFNPNAPRKVIHKRKPLPVFTDGYDHKEVPSESGLYLVGSIHADPHTYELQYWIKVGLSSNLAKRIRDYRTENPMLWVADILTVSTDIMRSMESDCHIMLSDVAHAIAKDTNEWFLVDRETYFEITEKKGFDYFFVTR